MEILNTGTKKVREKSGNFKILGQNCLVWQVFYPFWVSDYLFYFVLPLFAGSALLQVLENVCPKP